MKKTKILFLCVANSARSQIAEALAKSILGPEFEIQSAGSQPSGSVNPFAIEVMQEVGMDMRDHHSKSWDDLPLDFLKGLDYVITLCAEEICPTMISKAKKLNWGMVDPASAGQSEAERREAFRQTREAIKKKLSQGAALFV